MILSAERVRDELMKIMASDQPSVGIRLLAESGHLKQILPEVDVMRGMQQNPKWHHKDVYEHTLLVVDRMAKLTQDPILRFAALMHDVGKPQTYNIDSQKGVTFHGHEPIGASMVRRIMQRLKFTNEQIELVSNLTRDHLRLPMLTAEGTSNRAIRRAFCEVESHIEPLILLCRADMTSHNPKTIEKKVADFENLLVRMHTIVTEKPVVMKPPINGHDLMAMGLKAGPVMGQILKKLTDMVIEGDLDADDKETATKIAKELMETNGLTPMG